MGWHSRLPAIQLRADHAKEKQRVAPACADDKSRKTARYGGETLGKLIRNKTLWGCFLADGSVENWAFETDLLRAQVKACEFLEVRAPGRYQWPIGEARYKNVQRRW